MCTALTYAMTAVEAEPQRESARRETTAVHRVEGNTAEALRHFEAHRGRLVNSRRQAVALPTAALVAQVLSKCRRAHLPPTATPASPLKGSSPAHLPCAGLRAPSVWDTGTRRHR
jgi:hypothetical protein